MGRDFGEVMFAVMSEVSVHLPGPSKIVRPFDQHGSRTEGLEANNDVSEVELCLKVEAYRDILHPILGLPPRPEIYIFWII